jgi:hypothetical protein
MRAWAREDAVVAAAVAQTDKLRVRAVTALFTDAGLSPRHAEKRALQVAWAFRGSAGAEPKQRSSVLRDLIEQLVLDGG